jgi:hypothetical protein
VYIGDIFLELPTKPNANMTPQQFVVMVHMNIKAYAQQKRLPFVNLWNLYDDESRKLYGLINSERGLTPAGNLYVSSQKK